VIVVPLLVAGSVVGTFNVDSFTPNFYTERHLTVAMAFAERVTQALRNARLYMAEQQRAHAAEELARLRSDFVAAVSHELRTPLAAIIGYAELLQARWHRLGDAQRLERLGHIVVSANRQQRLIEDLLLLSQVENTGLDPLSAAMAIAAVVEQAAMEVQGSYPGQRIDLHGPADLSAWADPARTIQIVVNLLDNAAKYSPEGSTITVCWVLEGDRVVVRVRDQGAGVPAQGREYLFTRFGRVAGTRARAGRIGTGLGLFLGRQLAQAMGGDLDLETTGPKGSTFRLRLPH
jgi:two-component system sensor histidine kinase KdpD